MEAEYHQYPKVKNTHFTNGDMLGDTTTCIIFSCVFFPPDDKFLFLFYRGELIQSEKKTHVIIGDTELIILLHEIMGRTFLWPVFSQVSGDKVEGLLGK